MNIFSKFKSNLINAFYPKHIKCICCKDEIVEQNVYDLCEKCYTKLPLIKANFCTRCGLQFKNDASGVCLNCKSHNFHFTLARSSIVFNDLTAPIIHRLKYARYKFLSQPLSYLLYDTLLIQGWNIDLICYVPLFPTREKERGYNQSRELAIQLSKLSNIPICNDIERVRDTPTQTSLSRNQRQENVKDCFRIINPKQFEGLNILLIDDVFTTGSTTNEISKLLHNAHTNKIYVLTVAHAGLEQKF